MTDRNCTDCHGTGTQFHRVTRVISVAKGPCHCTVTHPNTDERGGASLSFVPIEVKPLPKRVPWYTRLFRWIKGSPQVTQTDRLDQRGSDMLAAAMSKPAPDDTARPHGTTIAEPGRTDAPVLLALARVCIAWDDARATYFAVEQPGKPDDLAGPAAWAAYGIATMGVVLARDRCIEAENQARAFVTKHRAELVAATKGTA